MHTNGSNEQKQEKTERQRFTEHVQKQSADAIQLLFGIFLGFGLLTVCGGVLLGIYYNPSLFLLCIVGGILLLFAAMLIPSLPRKKRAPSEKKRNNYAQLQQELQKLTEQNEALRQELQKQTEKSDTATEPSATTDAK